MKYLSVLFLTTDPLSPFPPSSSGLPHSADTLGGATGTGLSEEREEAVQLCGPFSHTGRTLHLHLPEKPGASPLGPVHAAGLTEQP